jgi:hypothetical protein
MEILILFLVVYGLLKAWLSGRSQQSLEGDENLAAELTAWNLSKRGRS